MTRPAPCHPNRPHWALGLCRPCYDVMDRERRRPGPRPCMVCGAKFQPADHRHHTCTAECSRLRYSWAQTIRRGGAPEERYAIRDPTPAQLHEIADHYLARGYVQVHPQAAASNVLHPRIFALWPRGGGLWAVRATLERERRAA